MSVKWVVFIEEEKMLNVDVGQGFDNFPFLMCDILLAALSFNNKRKLFSDRSYNPLA